MNPSLTTAAVVAEARGWIGTPYRHQGSLKGVGCDCLGLVRGVYRNCIGTEPEAPPPYGADWAEASGRETLKEAAMRHMHRVPNNELAAGDVLLFRWREGFVAKHAGIATSSSSMVHAHEGASVCEIALAPWWRRRLAFVFRFHGMI